MSGSITFFPNKDTLTSETHFTNGTFTVPKGIYHLLILACGGGGGGQGGNTSAEWSYSGQGGAGVIPHPIWVNVNPGDILTYTLGQGGIGGSGRSDRFLNNGGNGDPTVVTFPDGRSISFLGGRGGGGGSTSTAATAYSSQIAGGTRVLDSAGKNVDASNGASSHFAAGGVAGIRRAAIDEAFDAGGGGGGAGYEAGGNGGDGGDVGLGTAVTGGSNGGISAGGGGGGSNGAQPGTGSGGAGGNGGPGMIQFIWSENK